MLQTKHIYTPLKHHKFVKKEIKNLLEAGLVERSMSPYAAPIIVVPRKSKPGVNLEEIKRLVTDYHEFKKNPRFKLLRQTQNTV